MLLRDGKLLRFFIQPYLKKYGKLESIHFSRKQKSLFISIVPLGEKAAVNIEASGLSIEKQNGKYYLKYDQIKIDRSWMQNVFNDAISIKQVPIPRVIAAPLRLFIGKK